MSTDDDGKPYPQSVRHRQILDVAAEHPDTSIDELATMVPSATTQLVERVLEEHGDPAADDDQSTTATESDPETTEQVDDPEAGSTADTTPSSGPTEADESGATPTDADGDLDADTDAEAGPEVSVSPDDLSEKQRDVLDAIAERPEATQREIGDRLGVSATTVGNRANSIEGFEWSERRQFVEVLLGEPASAVASADGSSDTAADATETTPADAEESSTKGEDTDTPGDLGAKLEALDERVAELEAATERTAERPETVFEDPELVHRIVHACLNSEAISEAEELRILKELLG